MRSHRSARSIGSPLYEESVRIGRSRNSRVFLRWVKVDRPRRQLSSAGVVPVSGAAMPAYLLSIGHGGFCSAYATALDAKLVFANQLGRQCGRGSFSHAKGRGAATKGS